MKKVMFALCFMFGGIVVVTAQDTTSNSNQYRTETETQYSQDARSQAMQTQDDRERIQSTDLPDEVKRTLEGEEYRGWLISGAFKANAGDTQSGTDASGQNQEPGISATTPDDEEVYIVEMKNGAETKTLTFDKDGQPREGMDNSQPGEFNDNNQYNQSTPGQTDPATPGQYPTTPGTPGQTDPTQTDPGQQWDQSSDRPDQPIQTPETPATLEDQSLDQGSNQSWENQSPGQPTETQSSQPAQTDQPGSNSPR